MSTRADAGPNNDPDAVIRTFVSLIATLAARRMRGRAS